MAENTFTLRVEMESAGVVSGLKQIQTEIKKTNAATKDLAKGFGDALKDVDKQVSDITDSLKDLTTGGIKGAVSAIGDLTAGMGLAAGAIAGIALGTVAATAALIANGVAMAAAADDAAELAEKYGLTTTQLAAFELIAKENGGTVSGMIGVYDRLTNSLDEVASGNLKAENSFRRLGIAQSDIAGKSREEIAGMVLKNLAALGNTTQAVAAAADVLGKSFREQSIAIRAVSDSYADYENRIKGSVATKELEEAGARQEKAFSNLEIAVKGLKNTYATTFSEIASNAADWATEMVKQFTKAAESSNIVSLGKFANANRLAEAYGLTPEQVADAKEQAQKIADLANRPLGARLRDLTNDPFTTGTTDIGKALINQENTNRYLQEYAKNIRKVTDELDKMNAAETQRFINRSKSMEIKPLPDLVKPEQAKLSEEQKNVIALSNTMRSAFNDLDRQIAMFGDTGDVVAQQVKNLGFKLFDAGKGVIDLDKALEIAADQMEKIQKVIEGTNTAKLVDGVKNMNQGLQLQLDILSASTELQKEQVRLRAQLSKSFENQLGGPTPEQAKALEDALKNAAIQFERIANAKIGESVKNSMRDLTEQSRDLAFELTHFWDVHRDGLVNSNNALQSLYRTIDPEGRGANISKEQKDRLEAQLNFIEGQKRLIEQNKRIEESFRDLGSAVSDWALGSENGIKRVKIELIKLIALSAMRAYGSTGNSFADLFIGGVVSGLSGNRAAGGPVSAGRSYRVGEQGAETVTFGRSGYVMPKEQMSISTKSGGLVVSVNPKFENHGTINSTEDLDGYMTKWGEGVARHTEKFVREQFSASGMAYMR
jgi:hypothetical protein